MSLPPRRVLRSIVQDAILDREEMSDDTIRDRTKAIIQAYHDLLPRLADTAPALSEADKDLLATACRHARIWREGLVDSWANTGDKAVILECRQDVERVTRTETALGVVRHFLAGGPDPEGTVSMTIAQIRAMHPDGHTPDWMTRAPG